MSETQNKAVHGLELSHALLLLEAIFFADPRLEEEPLRLIFGFDYDAGFLRATFDL